VKARVVEQSIWPLATEPTLIVSTMALLNHDKIAGASSERMKLH
jgi:hypothetical protein